MSLKYFDSSRSVEKKYIYIRRFTKKVKLKNILLIVNLSISKLSGGEKKVLNQRARSGSDNAAAIRRSVKMNVIIAIYRTFSFTRSATANIRAASQFRCLITLAAVQTRPVFVKPDSSDK